jgi:hypothetical protein
LQVRLPRGYGLTAAERRAGLPPLNAEHTQELTLDGSTFEVVFPPVQYCVERALWQPMPPPPAWFVLRFSDAPDEEYLVWDDRQTLGYVVRDARGVERPKGRARWTVRLRGSVPRSDEGQEDLWLLELDLVPQPSPGGQAGILVAP